MELPADVLRNGHNIRWRANYLDIPRLSDITPDMGTLLHGQIYLGNVDTRHIGFSEEVRSFYANDELGRTYWRVSYTADYFRLGIETEPGITWRPDTGVRVDGRAIADSSIPPGKFDLGEFVNNLLDHKVMVCGQWVLNETNIVGYDETLLHPRVILDTDASIHITAPNDQAYLHIDNGELNFIFAPDVPVSDNLHLVFSIPANDAPPYEYASVTVDYTDNMTFRFKSNYFGLPPQFQMIDANGRGGVYAGDGFSIQDMAGNMSANMKVHSTTPEYSLYTFHIKDGGGSTIYSLTMDNYGNTIQTTYKSGYHYYLWRNDGTIIMEVPAQQSVCHLPSGIHTGLSLRETAINISNDSINVGHDRSVILLGAESGSTDTLSSINDLNDVPGQLLILRAKDAATTITVVNTGNIHVPTTRTLSGLQNTLTLINMSGGGWYEVSYS